MRVTVFGIKKWTPPQLPIMVVNVFHANEMRPPQLPSMVVSVWETSVPPSKVLMVSDTDQLTPLPLATILPNSCVF